MAAAPNLPISSVEEMFDRITRSYEKENPRTLGDLAPFRRLKMASVALSSFRGRWLVALFVLRMGGWG